MNGLARLAGVAGLGYLRWLGWLGWLGWLVWLARLVGAGALRIFCENCLLAEVFLVQMLHVYLSVRSVVSLQLTLIGSIRAHTSSWRT